MTDRLTHFDASGAAHMVDVSGKQSVRRTARACGAIVMAPETLQLIRDNLIEKGEVLAPDQRTVAEDPEVARMTGQRLAPDRCAPFLGINPVPQMRLLHDEILGLIPSRVDEDRALV